MIRQIIYYSFLVLMMSFASSMQPMVAQDYLQEEINQRSLDESRWNKLSNGVDYVEKETPTQNEVETKDRPEREKPSTLFKDASALRIILYIGFGALLLLVLVRLFTNKFTIINSKAPRKEFTIEEIEENIHESDIDRFLKEALKNRSYHLAIRLYYLKVIKELSLNNSIHWKKDKTNRDYLREMRPQENYSKFREITRIFDKVWYGEIKVDEKDYNAVEPVFKTFMKTIKKA